MPEEILPLNTEELEALEYFWKEKDDPTRHVDWNKWLPRLKAHHQGLLNAWNRYVDTSRIISTMFELEVRRSIETPQKTQ